MNYYMVMWTQQTILSRFRAECYGHDVRTLTIGRRCCCCRESVCGERVMIIRIQRDRYGAISSLRQLYKTTRLRALYNIVRSTRMNNIVRERHVIMIIICNMYTREPSPS